MTSRTPLAMLAAIAIAMGLPFVLQNESHAQSTSVVLVGAGDMVPDCNAGASTANAEATAKLLDATSGTVFTLGDNAYENGTYSDFTNCYDQTWGRSKSRTFPVTGNHDYNTAYAKGYFDYFNGVNVQNGPAGDRSGGYYGYNVGSWHIVVLNSECGANGLWDVNGCQAGSAQEQWLRADLAASPTNNIIAMFHKPRFSSGWKEGSVQPLWQALYEYGGDLVLNGHVHNYQRLTPASPTGARDTTYGIRQFVVGTGGKSLQTPSGAINLTEVNDASSYGVLKLTLSDNSYSWQFIHTPGGSLNDSGTNSVHGPPPHAIVASWQMEEGSGKTLLDSSGFGNNATIQGSPSWMTGQSGLALSFDGNTYAVAPDTGLLNPNTVTLAAWVNPARVATQYILKKTNAWEVGLSATGVPFFRLNNSSTYRIDASNPQANGSWMHLAGTFDGSTMHFYVNGVEQGTGIAGPAVINAVTASVGIGAQSDGTGTFKGLLDDVRLYNKALSATEIQALGSTGANAAPVVNAGPDQTLAFGTTATLNGTTTDDGLPDPPGALTIKWSEVSGPGTTTFANASSTSTTATFSATGTYTLQLSANDGALISMDRCVVTVTSTATNQPPLVNAGPDQTITLPAGAALSGTVTDDGLPNPPGVVTATWSELSGPGTTTFANASSASTTATFSAAGSYTLRLSAYDGALTSTDTVIVTVNLASTSSPTLVAYYKADEGGGTLLSDSSGAGNNGTINLTPTWITGHDGLAIRFGASAYVTVPDASSLDITGPLTIAAWIRPDATSSAYTQCLVKKGRNTTGAYDVGLSSTGHVYARLNNSSRYRVEGATAYPTDGTWMHVAVTYDGTTIRLYVNGALDGSVAGPSKIATNSLALGIGATADAIGKYKGAMDEARIYQGALSAADVQELAGGSGSANQGPVVDAGADQTIMLPSGATLSGTVTDDGLPNPPDAVTVTWSQVSGPGTTMFANPSSPSTTASFSAAGSNTLQLSAYDGALASTDTVVITASPQSGTTNQAPVVNAGPDQTTTLASGAALSGTVSDDGLPNPPGAVTVTWSQVSGPGTTTFANPSSASTTATFSVAGAYTLQLSANDGALTSTDSVGVMANSSGPTSTAPLVGYWKADEGGGTHLGDSSGLGNNGTINLTPTWITGHIGLAIRFGASAYVTVPDASSLDITGPVTIAAWIRPEATSSAYTQCLVKKGSNNTGAYDIGLSSTGHVYARLNNSSSYRVEGATAYPTDGTWMHVAVVYDGNTISLYVNAVLDGSIAGPTSITTNSLALGIGATADAIGKYKGAIDDVRLYNGALSASDIQALASQ